MKPKTVEHIYLIGMYDTLLNLHNNVSNYEGRIYDKHKTGRGIDIVTSLTPYPEYMVPDLELMIPARVQILALRDNNLVAYYAGNMQVSSSIIESIKDTSKLTEEKIAAIKNYKPKGFNKTFSSLISFGLLSKEDQEALENEALRFSLMGVSVSENLKHKDQLVLAIGRRIIK